MSAFTKIVAHAKVRNVEVVRTNPKNVDFFTAESLGVEVPPRCKCCKSCKDCKFEAHQLSIVEQKELETIRKNLQLNPVSSKWVTEYPYKTDPKVLKDNRMQATSILIRTENRLKKNKVTSEKYCEQFQDFIKRGIFKEIDDEEIKNYIGPVRYVSHHEVFKEESTSTPVRIVLNSSLRFHGLSLNDILMKGPNSLSDLFSIQLKFRTYQCALIGDIQKMYHSIQTTERERHLRRVLWRNMKTEQPIKTYGTETVTFGDKPAAAISAVAIQETAEAFKHIDKNAANKLKDEMYVDDIVTGDSNSKNVDVLKESIKEILSKGGFFVKGFVQSGDTSKENLALLGTGEVGRVLGICWNPEHDEFAVKVRINLSKKYTGARRESDLGYQEIYTERS